MMKRRAPTRIGGSIVAVLWAALAVGCQADPLPAADAGSAGGDDGGAEMGIDGAAGTGGEGGQGGDAMIDAMPEPEPDVEPVDMGAGGMDMAVDVGFDEGVGGGEMVDPPEIHETAITRRGDETFFVWVDADGQLVSLEVDDDARVVAGPTVVAQPAVRPERVVAREVDGYPWVAFGSAGEPVVLFQVDLPGQTRIVLDQLFGPPLLAQAGDGILVIAQTADGRLAWQRVTHDLQVRDRVVDTIGLRMPDDAAAVSAGVVLYFATEGQCVQISDETWRAAGTFVCPTGPGRLVSDGQRTLLSRIYTFGVEQNIGLTALYEASEEYLVAFFENSDGTAFSNDGSQRPLVGRRTVDGSRRLVATIVGPYETWDSVDSWFDSSEWPFDRIRAMGRRTLPRRARTGTCGDGNPCTEDDDCEEDACLGAVGAEHIVALDFRDNGRPRIRTFELRRRSVGDPSYRIPNDLECIPVPEVCDNADQDCDGDVNDGLCCEGTTPQVEYFWLTQAAIATIGEGDDARYEMVVGDVELNNAYRMMYRLAGTERWEGKNFSLNQRQQAPDTLGIIMDDAVDGRFVLAAGGVTGLVARQWIEGGPGDWAVFMAHPSRGPEDFPPRAVAPIGCSEVLAADTLNHRSVRGGNPTGEQFLVVCPDKIVRVYAVVGGETVSYDFEQFNIPRVEWATIHRSGPGELELLVGYRVPGEGQYAVRSLVIEGGNDIGPEPSGFRPPELDLLGLTDAISPLYRHPVIGRPPLQIRDGRDARMAFVGEDAQGDERLQWQDVLLAPDPMRTVFAPAGYRIYATGRVQASAMFEEATGWWAADIRGDDDVYNLWSTEPVYTVDGPVSYWYASQGSYGNDDRSVNIANYDVVIVTPTAEGGRNWRLITRQTRCLGPQGGR